MTGTEPQLKVTMSKVSGEFTIALWTDSVLVGFDLKADRARELSRALADAIRLLDQPEVLP